MPTTLEPENTLTPGPMSCDVAIVGYGPVGMVLSGLLAQRESYLSYQPRRIFAVNADSQFLMATAVMRSMRDNGWGRIVNLASNSLGLAVPGLVPYMAAKGAVVGFTRALATDLAPFGITVNAVCPDGPAGGPSASCPATTPPS